MNLVNNVYEIAEKFIKKPQYVTINNRQISFISQDIKAEKPPTFPITSDRSNQFKTCLMELVAGSINYCYWYGNSYIRPNNSSSGKMYQAVSQSFKNYKNGDSFDDCLEILIKVLSLSRFPLLSERVLHLKELKYTGEFFINSILNEKQSLDEFLSILVSLFPGYASDIFLKRAFLFFAQLNRIYGWFEEEMKNLPVPADYQVPKILEHFSILEYNSELKKTIKKNKLIPKGSLMECEIRASTIIACRELCKNTGWTMPQIDGYFWLQRKKVATPFHLTLTSDY